jgi:hypothetical protein
MPRPHQYVLLLRNSANRSLNYAEFFGLCAMLFNFCKQRSSKGYSFITPRQNNTNRSVESEFIDKQDKNAGMTDGYCVALQARR